MEHIPLNEATFAEQEIQAAIEVLRSGQLTMGEQCKKFESIFANAIGVKHAVFVNSGSSANLLAAFAIANFRAPTTGKRRTLKPGDEVIVPALTWSTTVWPIIQAGGVPVFVDSDPETLQLRVQDLPRALSEKTVGIFPVHVLGSAVEMGALLEFSRTNRLWVVEDTCESLGTRQGAQTVGTLGDIGTFSFFFSHHITTIEGGMVTTNDEDLAEVLRSLRAHGWTRHLSKRSQWEARYPDLDPRFLFINTGFNVRPTEIQAAFGIPQMGKLEGFNRKRREVTAQWRERLEPFVRSGSLRISRATPGTEAAWFGFPVLCASKSDRIQFRDYLEKNGIETRPIICGNLTRHPAFEHINFRVATNLQGADEVMDCGIYWGSHPMMTPQAVDYVAKTVERYFA